MKYKKSNQRLLVYMNGMMVGTLSKIANGQLTFQYSDNWLNWNDSRPISLSLPLQNTPFKGDLVNNFFDNLLPDNDLIRKRIQARFQINQNHCFNLLSKIGTDCVGAIQLLDEDKEINQPAIQGRRLDNKMIAKYLKNYKNAPLGMQEDSDFRISIAGVQEKTAFLKYKGQWWLPEASTPTTHIFKLPIGFLPHAGIDLTDSCENEWLCLKILKAYGLPINNATIEIFEDTKALVVERFDRRFSEDKSWIIRLPQEDLCQAFGISSALKYESDGGPGIMHIMHFLKSSLNPMKDREQFFKSVVLFWILGATDGHAKNFSILLEPKGGFQLSPLYDVLSAFPFVANHQLRKKNFKMAMSLEGKNRHYHWHELQYRHWLNMAQLCQFPEFKIKHMIEEIGDNMESIIDTIQTSLPAEFPAKIALPIFNGMREARDILSQADK